MYIMCISCIYVVILCDLIWDIMENSGNSWDLVSYVFRSQYRYKVLKVLIEPKTPIQIAQTTNIRINHVSNVLIGLAEKLLVRCLNPNDKRGRFYQISEKGLHILAKLNNIK